MSHEVYPALKGREGIIPECDCQEAGRLCYSPVQSLCAGCFKRPTWTTSEFGVRNCLLMGKVSAWEDGGTYRSSNPSPESPEFRILLCQRKGEKDGKEVIDDLDIWAPAGIWGRVRNLEISLFLVCLSAPADLSYLFSRGNFLARSCSSKNSIFQ